MDEPQTSETSVDIWIRWIEHLVATDGAEFLGDVGVEDVFHDIGQSVLFTIEDRHTRNEVARCTGLALD